ncbi:MAG: iron-containing alcohol dehydrogenase [Alphaproteobacteria bacterium]
MTLAGRFSYPTDYRLGAGEIEHLQNACTQYGINRPLLVTDKGLAGSDSIARMMTLCGLSPDDLFSDISPNPTGEDVEAGIAVFQNGKHDGVIAVGGGSALDAGKAIAFAAGQSRPMWDFEDIGDWWTRADPDNIAPVIAVPTTAGTGSEVGRASVITKTEDQTKRIIFHPAMLPVCVIADPELTVTLPPALTAATGMDALAHCLEALMAHSYHPFSEAMAVEGARLVRENLLTAMMEPDNIYARTNMLAAASMGALAFQKGLGAVHALSHPLGAMFNAHHGTLNAVLLPAVLRFNCTDHAVADKLTRLARLLNLPGDANPDTVIDWVEGLNRSIGMPSSLNALGVDPSRADEVVEKALKDPSAGGNPITLDAQNLHQLLADSMQPVDA